MASHNGDPAKSRHEQAEAAIVGREGMTGIPVVLGNDRWVNDTYVQVDGHGLRITAHELRQAMAKSASLRAILLAFTQALVVQTAQTAMANARGNVEMRLARWLRREQALSRHYRGDAKSRNSCKGPQAHGLRPVGLGACFVHYPRVAGRGLSIAWLSARLAILVT